jgi:hypothetical protein
MTESIAMESRNRRAKTCSVVLFTIMVRIPGQPSHGMVRVRYGYLLSCTAHVVYETTAIL